MEFVAKYEMKETSKDHVNYAVTVAKEPWQKALEAMIREQTKDAKVKGFKDATKAPISLLRSHADMVHVYQSAIESLLNQIADEIIVDSKVTPLIFSGYNPVKVTDDELEISIDLILLPKIKLGKYKGLKAEKPVEEVTEEQIDHAIKHALQEQMVLNPIEGRPAQDGDTVIIDYEGFLDGVPFEGGKDTDSELNLGSHSFIPGFEEQIVGHEIGQNFDIEVKFPDDYHAEDLKGKVVIFKIALKEIKERIVPELNDEFVQSLEIEGVTTVAQYHDHEKEKLAKQADRRGLDIAMSSLLEQIVATSDIPVYDEYIESMLIRDIERHSQNIQQQIGGTLEDYLEMTGTNKEEFVANVRENCVRNYQVAMIINDIISAEKILVTDEEVDAKLAEIAAVYGIELEQFKSILASQLDQFRNELLNEKFEEFMIKNNKIG